MKIEDKDGCKIVRKCSAGIFDFCRSGKNGKSGKL